MGNIKENFDQMAEQREAEAQLLDDVDVWRSIIEKVVLLDSPSDMKADILFTSIPDIGVVLTQLKNHFEKGNFDETSYKEIVDKYIAILRANNTAIDFDPYKL
ncbi:MAG: hypothetical protein OEZ01_01850 [Candidatus Heimdallarchaeota archaeon]|nr:hypothetical protein [Candidatus Heimdallarchaeota archaeon]MDH5644717.1 hypothetical protein [Candidatus Heimdallarchaeota archaeon]